MSILIKVETRHKLNIGEVDSLAFTLSRQHGMYVEIVEETQSSFTYSDSCISEPNPNWRVKAETITQTLDETADFIYWLGMHTGRVVDITDIEIHAPMEDTVRSGCQTLSLNYAGHYYRGRNLKRTYHCFIN